MRAALHAGSASLWPTTLAVGCVQALSSARQSALSNVSSTARALSQKQADLQALLVAIAGLPLRGHCSVVEGRGGYLPMACASGEWGPIQPMM